MLSTTDSLQLGAHPRCLYQVEDPVTLMKLLLTFRRLSWFRL